jgi:peptide/nickel transport system permease protein
VTRYIARRLLALIPVMIGITAIVFFAMRAVPGDPIVILFGADVDPVKVDPEAIRQLRHAYGLDEPLPIQYLAYLGHLVTGDFGRSIVQHAPVFDLIVQKMPATLELAISAMLIAVIIGVPLGMFVAVRRGSLVDKSTLLGASFLFAAPGFWIAIVLILVFAVQLRWLPTSGRGDYSLWDSLLLVGDKGWAPLGDALRHLVLPAITLSLTYTAVFVRLTRSTVLEALREDYVRTARAKGLSERVVGYRHVLRNAMLPIITAGGLYFAQLLGGTVLIEVVFAWPGVGRLGIDALRFFDYSLVQGVVILTALLFSLANLTVDLLYAVVDPRIRYS